MLVNEGWSWEQLAGVLLRPQLGGRRWLHAAPADHMRETCALERSAQTSLDVRGATALKGRRFVRSGRTASGHADPGPSPLPAARTCQLLSLKSPRVTLRTYSCNDHRGAHKQAGQPPQLVSKAAQAVRLSPPALPRHHTTWPLPLAASTTAHSSGTVSSVYCSAPCFSSTPPLGADAAAVDAIGGAKDLDDFDLWSERHFTCCCHGGIALHG